MSANWFKLVGLPVQMLAIPLVKSGLVAARTLARATYPVEFLLELLSGGMSPEQILADYSDLEADDLRAVYVFAARLSRVQRINPAAA